MREAHIPYKFVCLGSMREAHIPTTRKDLPLTHEPRYLYTLLINTTLTHEPPTQRPNQPYP